MSSTRFQTTAMLAIDCENEAELLAAEILGELRIEEDEVEYVDLCLIQTKRHLHDTTEEALRREKIAELRRKISNGTYKIDTSAVAQALLESVDL